MDYVLFGMGYGATLMLLGWALRTFGPERKYRDVNPEDIDRTIAQRRWVRFIQGLGGVIAIAGTAMVLFTFVIMLVNPDDETGSFMAMVIWGFLALAVLIWCWFYVASYGLLGVWSREEGYGVRGSSSTSKRELSEAISTTHVVPTPTTADPEPQSVPGLVEEIREENDSKPDVSTPPPADEGDDSVLIGPTMDQSVVEDEEDTADPDPEYDFGDSADTTVPGDPGGRSEAIRRLRERQARSGNTTT